MIMDEINKKGRAFCGPAFWVKLEKSRLIQTSGAM